MVLISQIADLIVALTFYSRSIQNNYLIILCIKLQ